MLDAGHSFNQPELRPISRGEAAILHRVNAPKISKGFLAIIHQGKLPTNECAGNPYFTLRVLRREAVLQTCLLGSHFANNGQFERLISVSFDHADNNGNHNA